MVGSLRSRFSSWRNREYLALALIILLAAFLRFYQLDLIPVGLSGDEGADGLGAKRILSGEALPLFITEDFGEEPMHTYLVALSFAVWGTRLWAIRFVSAVVGLLTIPVIFWLAKELFPAHDNDSSRLIPILSAFWLATSYWHIIYSRGGLEVVTLPLFSCATVYFLCRGIRSETRWPFVVSGLLLGTSLYAYRGARFLPIFLLIFFGGWVLANRDFRRRQFLNLVLVAGIAAVVFAPLAAYGLAHPDIFFAREIHVSIFNPDWGRGSPIQALGEGLVKTMAMFNFQGDPEFDRNPGRRAVLDPISSLCFAVGLAMALARWKRPNHLLVICWFFIMALPGAFTAEVLPHFHRGIGALPPLCLLCAVGLVVIKDWLEDKAPWKKTHSVSWGVISIILVSTTLLSYRSFFLPWQQRLSRGEIIGGTYMEAAEVMNTTRISDGVWILPASSLRPRILPYYEVDFLYEGPEPHYTLNVDEETAPGELTQICQGHRQAAVVNWKQFVLEEAYLSLNSDPKGLLDFLLRKYGRRTGEEPYDSFDLVRYELPSSPDLSIAHSFEPMEANFGNQLVLEGVAFGGSSLHPTTSPQEAERKVLPSGKEGWVVLQWRALTTPGSNYKVAVYLLDGRGRLVGQVDKLLLSNHLRPTSHWQTDQVEMDYYTLPCPPATPPGEYSVAVVVYDAATFDRLTILDSQAGAGASSMTVGILKVVEPLAPPVVEPTQRLAPSETDVAPGIRLLGYDAPLQEVGPGETLSVALYWQALEEVQVDYTLSLQISDGGGDVWAEQVGRPVDNTYPTTEWEEGEILRDWHDLPLRADMPQGEYDLLIQIFEGENPVGQASLGRIEVRGRVRHFIVPEIQHPLEATLGQSVLFLGYDLHTNQVKAGEAFHLTLYWQALEEMEISYTVFTHLLDAGNHIWGQMDSPPRGGEAPTTSWVPGEIIADEYEIVVDPQAPPAECLIEIGMYDPSTMERLSVIDAGGEVQADRLLLQTVSVLE